MERNLIGEMNMMKESGAKPNFTDIARRCGVDRHTVAKYWNGGGPQPPDGREGRGSGFDRYRAEIEGKAALPGMTKRGLHEFLLDRHAGDEPPVPGYNAFTLFQVICGFFVMAVLYSRSMEEKRTAVEQELATQRQLWHQRKVQLEAAQENLDLLNCKYHDLKHYIAALRSQNSLQDSASVLDELEESVKVFDCAVRTGNTILDTVLTEKSLLCERRNKIARRSVRSLHRDE